MGPKQRNELRKTLHDFIVEHGANWRRTLVLADDATAGIKKLRTLAWAEMEKWASEFRGGEIERPKRRFSAEALLKAGLAWVISLEGRDNSA